jgi:hypothetical protein
LSEAARGSIDSSERNSVKDSANFFNNLKGNTNSRTNSIKMDIGGNEKPRGSIRDLASVFGGGKGNASIDSRRSTEKPIIKKSGSIMAAKSIFEKKQSNAETLNSGR